MAFMIIFMVFTIPYFDFFIPRYLIAKQIWAFSLNIGLIEYLLNIFAFFFDRKKAHFVIFLGILYFFAISYLIASKYLLLHKNEISLLSTPIFFSLYFFIVIGIFISYLQLILSSAVLVYTIAPSFLVKMGLENWEVKTLEALPPQIPSTSSSTSTSSTEEIKYVLSIILKHKHNHTHYHYPENISKNIKWFRGVGYFIGLSGLGVAGYAAYQQKLQTIAAVNQANEMRRQNDLEALSQELITKEEYFKRNPGDRPSSVK